MVFAALCTVAMVRNALDANEIGSEDWRIAASVVESVAFHIDGPDVFVERRYLIKRKGARNNG